MGNILTRLCEPIKIGNVQLKNRMIAQPMGSLLCTEEGNVTDRLREIYRVRARGGFSVVVMEANFIRDSAQVLGRMCNASHPSQGAGLGDIADIIHEEGAKACIQLLDPGGLSDSRWLDVPSWAPSSITNRVWVPPPKEMTEDEIQKTIDCFVQAAARSQNAGFDMIMLHFCHGMLGMQFMTPYTNRRTDKWGDPAAYPMEVIRRVKKQVNIPVYPRISGDDMMDLTPPDRKPRAFANTYALDPNRFGRATLEHMLKIVPRLIEAGADAIDVSAGNAAAIDDYCVIPPIYKPRGVLVHLAEAIKKVSRVPVITVGRICDPRLAESIIARGKADIVGFGRVAYADTDYAKKVVEGKHEDVRMCIACDICTMQLVFGLGGAKCAVNYSLGKLPYEYELVPTTKPKKVLVVGGGVAGMEAARVAATRGHDVTLYERHEKLGGCVARLASRLPRLNTRDLNNIVKWQIQELQKLDLTIQLGKEVTRDLVKAAKPDIVIVATGAQPFIPENIPGISDEKVIILDEYLTKQKTNIGEIVVVIGGQNGAEVAYSLTRDGKRVILVEASNRITQAPYLRARGPLLQDYLRQASVLTMTETELKSITPEGVVVADKEGQEQTIKADTVLIALERVPDNNLAKQLKGIASELHEIGDCVQPKHIGQALHAGYRIGRII